MGDNRFIYVNNVVKKYQNKVVLNNINVEIAKGEFITVIGSSGCGKTTFLKMINGLINPDSGAIYINGIDVAKVNKIFLRRNIGYVIQEIGLFPHMTIRKNISYILRLKNEKDKEKIEKRVRYLINLVGLNEELLDRYPGELSGGQRQRIGIARALALSPKIIICDEAVSALDVSVQAQVLNLLQELKNKLGLTYFFISHNLNVVYQVSDRVGVMYLGKMVEIARYDQLYEKRFHPYPEALLSAIPQTDPDKKTERIHLEGEVPSPSNPPGGCHFHTRCPKACDICSQKEPPLKEIEPGHYVACHLYE